MHTEIKTPAKDVGEMELPHVIDRHSFLEDDLALSSSTHDSFNKTSEFEDKSHETSPLECTDVPTSTQSTEKSSVVYVSEDAQDCNYDETLSRQVNMEQQQLPQQPQQQLDNQTLTSFSVAEEENPSSPELFDSDEADDEAESTISTYPRATLEEPPTQTSPEKLSSTEMILRADKYLYRRINKFLSGVPPPPNHTISQKDCDDFLTSIKENRSYFWADPFKKDTKGNANNDSDNTIKNSNQENNEESSNCDYSKRPSQVNIPRDLSTAFDACEKFSRLRVDASESLPLETDMFDATNTFGLSDTLFNSSLANSSVAIANEDNQCCMNDVKTVPTLYTSIKVEDVVKLPWPAVYEHKCLEIYYNRNKMIEEFENLRLKLCDRYIGNETQSTCNVFFTQQAPGSARKKSLLARRNNGQSPGKRLSYLARRRRTFSSANLQGLNVAEKKLTLNIKKMQARKGKSPKIKNTRIKTPKSSGKKRQIRRLTLEGPSPRRRIDIPKRALFQSPPTEKSVSSRIGSQSTFSFNNDPKKVKRALFPTPTKNNNEMNYGMHPTESRKRKNEEELENPRQKWAKSLSFDCPRTLNNNTTNCNPVRHSMGSLSQRETTSNSGRKELSDIHRKKLLWAVAEALKTKGIEQGHPMFKQYLNSLARTVRKWMPDLDNKYLPRKPGSTSDRMLKLAKRHVILLVESTSNM